MSESNGRQGEGFALYDATEFSAPEPPATPQAAVPHQWYITSEIPETTIAAGTCFGPPDTGMYLATRVNTFVSTGGDLNFQVTGQTNVDLVGDVTINVTNTTWITTPSTIDVTAKQTITIVSGEGSPAVLYPNHPGNEAGDPEHGGEDGVEGHTQHPPQPVPWGVAHGEIPPPVSGGSLAIRLGARAMAGGVGAYHLYEAAHAGSAVGVFAAAGVIAGAAVGAAVGVMAFAKSNADEGAIAAAAETTDRLPPGPGGVRPEKGEPDIDMTAYANIVGKAQTGIAWFTPAAIKSTAGTAIQANAPIIQHNAENILANTAGDFIWNYAGMEIKNEAVSIVNSATAIATTALAVNTSAGFISNSMLGGISASVSGGVGASFVGLALAELASFGITKVEGGVVLDLIGGALTTLTTPLFLKVTPTHFESGSSKTGVWASIKGVAASKSEAIQNYLVTSQLQSFKSAQIRLA